MVIENQKQAIQGYTDLYEEVLQRTGDQVLSCWIMHELSKDRRMAQIASERNGSRHSESADFVPATAKQKEFLKDLGVQLPERLSKQRASELIDEATGNQGR